MILSILIREETNASKHMYLLAQVRVCCNFTPDVDLQLVIPTVRGFTKIALQGSGNQRLNH